MGKAYWLVWNQNRAYPHHRHESEQSAEREANRLAALNPGERFFVMRPIAAYEKREVIRIEFDLSGAPVDDDIPF